MTSAGNPSSLRPEGNHKRPLRRRAIVYEQPRRLEVDRYGQIEGFLQSNMALETSSTTRTQTELPLGRCRDEQGRHAANGDGETCPKSVSADLPVLLRLLTDTLQSVVRAA